MIVIPAIDLKGGKCVRLRQGRADEITVYGDDPVKIAEHWVAGGAAWLHVVDLDGAFEGHPVHAELVGRIASAAGVPVEVGGGLRTESDVSLLLEKGATRVIVGTRALEDPGFLPPLAKRFGQRLAVGIDSRDGFVQTRGWVETTRVRATDLAAQVCRSGVRTLICTDTATDGMLSGTNTDVIAKICDEVDCEVIASGGISSVADMEALCSLQRGNLSGAIVGKALYEGAVTLAELAAAAAECGR